MFINYSLLEYNKFILAFQLQFGTYEAESEHFRWEKGKRHFNKWCDSLYPGMLCCVLRSQVEYKIV